MSEETEMYEKMEECWRCGGEPDTNTLERSHATGDDFYISCMQVGCGAEGPMRKSLAEAIAAWNHRPDSAQLKSVEQERDKYKAGITRAIKVLRSKDMDAATLAVIAISRLNKALTPDKENGNEKH